MRDEWTPTLTFLPEFDLEKLMKESEGAVSLRGKKRRGRAKRSGVKDGNEGDILGFNVLTTAPVG